MVVYVCVYPNVRDESYQAVILGCSCPKVENEVLRRACLELGWRCCCCGLIAGVQRCDKIRSAFQNLEIRPRDMCLKGHRKVNLVENEVLLKLLPDI